MARIGQAYSPGGGAGGDATIPEYEGDPGSSQAEDVWISRTELHTPIGLLLTLTHTTNTYRLSYKTESGVVIRVAMS